MNLGGWEHRWTESRILHVLPIDDLKEHEPDGCWCSPEERFTDNGAVYIVHNSMDEREKYERREMREQ